MADEGTGPTLHCKNLDLYCFRNIVAVLFMVSSQAIFYKTFRFKHRKENSWIFHSVYWKLRLQIFCIHVHVVSFNVVVYMTIQIYDSFLISHFQESFNVEYCPGINKLRLWQGCRFRSLKYTYLVSYYLIEILQDLSIGAYTNGMMSSAIWKFRPGFTVSCLKYF
jgi:hypothetical protein